MDKHMKFPQDVMRQYCRHQVKMISVKPSDGDIIHIALRLQLADRVFPEILCHYGTRGHLFMAALAGLAATTALYEIRIA